MSARESGVRRGRPLGVRSPPRTASTLRTFFGSTKPSGRTAEPEQREQLSGAGVAPRPRAVSLSRVAESPARQS